MGIFNAKARGLMLESAVGSGQNDKLLNVSDISELRCVYVLRLAPVSVFCGHPVLSSHDINFLTSKGQV